MANQTLADCFDTRSLCCCNTALQENSASNVGAGGVDGGVHTDRGSRPTSPEHPYYVGVGGERSVAPSVKRGGDRPVMEIGAKPPLPGFPISHLLEFGAAARGERQVLSDRLSSEFGVPQSTALAALEAFGPDFRKARTWLQTKSQGQQQVCFSLWYICLVCPHHLHTIFKMEDTITRASAHFICSDTRAQRSSCVI